MTGVDDLARQLGSLGVEPGGVLVVHTAFSRVGPVEGGPSGLIDALCRAVGPEGTLVMPAMSDSDDEVFDVATTPCRAMGIVADTFWRLPDVRRGDSPHSFAATGPLAATITRPQPVDVPHGPDSPPGRVHELGGQILLVGVGHESNTTIHLAEALAGVRYRLPKYVTVRVNGGITRVEYAETDHCCQRFAVMDGWLEAAGRQVCGMVGQAEARLVRSRDVVAAALTRLRADETTFLHPPGVDEECDRARSSLQAQPWAPVATGPAGPR